MSRHARVHSLRVKLDCIGWVLSTAAGANTPACAATTTTTATAKMDAACRHGHQIVHGH